MKAVIPAAGPGTRLRPLTEDRPKALVEVAGRPLVHHVLDAVLPLGIEAVVLVVGYQAADVIAAVGETHLDVPVRYVRQPEPTGLADAVLRAERYVDDDFLVVNGDNATDADLSPVLDCHQARGADATVAVERVTRAAARETGVAVVQDGRLVRAVEKPDEPPSRVALTGVGVFSPRVFDACRIVTPSDRGERELAAAIDLLARVGRQVEAVPFPGWRLNVNTPGDVEAASDRLG